MHTLLTSKPKRLLILINPVKSYKVWLGSTVIEILVEKTEGNVKKTVRTWKFQFCRNTQQKRIPGHHVKWGARCILTFYGKVWKSNNPILLENPWKILKIFLSSMGSAHSGISHNIFRWVMLLKLPGKLWGNVNSATEFKLISNSLTQLIALLVLSWLAPKCVCI